MGLLQALGKSLVAFNEGIRKSKAEEPKATTIDVNAQYAWGITHAIGQGLKKPSKISFQTLRRMSRSYHIARLCINTLKHEISKTKWSIVPLDPKEGADPAHIKAVEELLRKPNKNNETFRTLVDKTLEDILSLDAGVWEKVRNPKGEISELYYVDGATIRPIFDIHGQVGDPAYVQVFEQGYRYSSGIEKVLADWKNEDLVYMMQNPQSDIRSFGYGMSPIESIIMVATNALMADDYNGKYFEDDSIPNGLVWLGANASQQQVGTFREFWNSELKGHHYKTPIVGGIEKPEIIQYKPTQTDMQFMEYAQWLAKITVAAFEMSPQDVGLSMDMYKTEGQVQQEISKNQGMRSLLNLLQEYINQEIIWEDPGWDFNDIMFAWQDIDVIDGKKRAEIDEKELKLGIKSINEARKERGLDGIVGGEKPYIMTGQGPQYIDATPTEGMSEEEIDQLRVQEEATEPTEEPTEEPNEELPIKKRLKKKAIIAEGDWESIQRDLTNHIQGKLKSLWPRVEALIPKVKKGSDTDEWDTEKPTWDETFDPAPWIAAYTLGLTKMFNGLKSRGYDIELTPLKALQTDRSILKERSRMSQRSALNTLHDDVRHYLETTDATSYKQMSEDLKGIMGWEDGWRAKRIANTETRWALNNGRLRMMKEAGVNKYKAYPGPRVCKICIDYTNNFTKIFSIDNKDVFPLHPNCMCIMEAEI